MTPEDYFKKWSENCRVFIDYKPIHSHEDMMRFAEDYHQEKMKQKLEEIKVNSRLFLGTDGRPKHGSEAFKKLWDKYDEDAELPPIHEEGSLNEGVIQETQNRQDAVVIKKLGDYFNIGDPISISLIQRKFKCGYFIASRVFGRFYAIGIIDWDGVTAHPGTIKKPPSEEEGESIDQ